MEEKVIAMEEREENEDNKLQESKIEETDRNIIDSQTKDTEVKPEWKAYKNIKRTRSTKVTNDAEKESNLCKVLAEVDDETEANEAVQENNICKNKEATTINTMKCFDVKAMTLNEIDEVVKEYKKER